MINALSNITYGMYLVGSKYDGKYSGCISTTVCQSTSEPETITVIINKNNYTHSLIELSKDINISILSTKNDFSFISNFGFRTGKDVDKLENIEYIDGENGVPIVTKNTVAYICAKVINSFDAITHTIFHAKVIKAETINLKMNLVPMTYEYYTKVIKGKSPKNAPTFSLNDKVHENEEFNKYKCTNCGYVYDENEIDNHGVKFEDLPEDYVCPICGMNKEGFIKI